MSRAKTYTQMRQEFQDKFFNQLSPVLQKYDGERKSRLVLAGLGAGIFSVLGIFFGVCGLISDSSNAETIKCAIYMFCAAWGLWYIIKKSFENKIKDKIMPDVCKCFDDLTWMKGKGIYCDAKMFSDSNLIPQFSSADFDDIFYGKYKGVKFEIVESEFESGTGKTRCKVFDGVVVKLDMNKNFKGNTVICPDSLFHTTPSAALRHTTLEDVVFEKQFDVYTDDEVEARYLITPSFMERLNNMKVAFKADKVSCSFYEKYLFVALNTSKDLFSLCSLVKPVNDAKQFFQMFVS